MARRKQEEWLRLAQAWARSGKSQKAFCEGKGISLWALRNWRKKMAVVTEPARDFVEVTPCKAGDLWQAASGTCRIVTNGYSIELGDGVSSETVVTVLRAVEALCGRTSTR